MPILPLLYSVIIPVFNRPDEMQELLQSLSEQSEKNFEIVVVEDGSSQPCEAVLQQFAPVVGVPFSYYFKPNEGPGIARNYGAARAQGDFFLFFDSDCLLPATYFAALNASLRERPCDAFGGPDRAHASFSPLQKAINYAMTSFFTTGGIRGGSEKMDNFVPRSFNMGFSRKVFEAVGGFPEVRFAAAKAAGEDIELSMRIRQKGFRVCLVPQAYVYHKRRSTWRSFFRQTFNFGVARVSLHRRNRGALKMVHLLPALFVLACLACVAAALFMQQWRWLALPLLAAAVFFADALRLEKNVHIALLSVAAAFVQLWGYGLGFLQGVWRQLILKKQDFE
ncbi:MAG: glycosyltransferase [Sphingobacteriales bacterium]|nr:glycosyltransferase [Sphingobacteriales bacterium]